MKRPEALLMQLGCATGWTVASSLVQVVTDASPFPPPPEGTIVTIGAFDGVHVGHRALIAEVRRLAAERGCLSALVTFDRHPATVVRPESAPKLITDAAQRFELLATTGLDITLVVTFDEARSLEPADDFVNEILVARLGARAVVVGEDFHFGHNRSGNVELLRRVGASAGFDVEPLGLLPRIDGIDEPVSSTAVRRALAGGQVEVAATLLGRPFEARGIVVTGDQRGRLLGFPTANVEIPNQICLPADGVYAGRYVRPDGSSHPCAINIGRRPTFYEHADHSLLEAHLLDFDADLYGEAAQVQFVAFLRSERKFDGIDALIAQLKHDVEHARAALS
jgi:riboflavin kinase/FMN adenylyltransferase